MSNRIEIRKSDGRTERYSRRKLARALQRSGGSKSSIDHWLPEIERQLADRTTSDDIHEITIGLLREESPLVAARYRLGRALQELGPGGYAFEHFAAALLTEQGYFVRVGETLSGKCVDHEVDVVARRHDELLFGECKHRSSPGLRLDVKVALYVYARSLDLRAGLGSRSFDEFWIMTNAKLSSDAIRYAKCVGLQMLGWDYPKDDGLRDRIERYGVYPITCLSELPEATTRRLLDQRVTTCRELLADPRALEGLDEYLVDRIRDEAEQLIENGLES